MPSIKIFRFIKETKFKAYLFNNLSSGSLSDLNYISSIFLDAIERSSV
jgi:hypothetical protein